MPTVDEAVALAMKGSRQVQSSAVAPFITLLLVPVLYSITVPDLKVVKWQAPPADGGRSIGSRIPAFGLSRTPAPTTPASDGRGEGLAGGWKKIQKKLESRNQNPAGLEGSDF